MLFRGKDTSLPRGNVLDEDVPGGSWLPPSVGWELRLISRTPLRPNSKRAALPRVPRHRIQLERTRTRRSCFPRHSERHKAPPVRRLSFRAVRNISLFDTKHFGATPVSSFPRSPTYRKS